MSALPHVLLVEDSALVADAMRVLFEATGHRVSVAATVDEAVAAGTDAPVDVMLLDVSLGSEDGLRVLGLLRDRQATPGTTFAMTGHDDAETVRRCLDAGCREVLLKPFPTRDLLRKVGEAVG